MWIFLCSKFKSIYWRLWISAAPFTQMVLRKLIIWKLSQSVWLWTILGAIFLFLVSIFPDASSTSWLNETIIWALISRHSHSKLITNSLTCYVKIVPMLDRPFKCHAEISQSGKKALGNIWAKNESCDLINFDTN